MTLISSALYIRQQAESFMLDSCTLRVFTGYSTIDGEYTEQFTEQTNIKCRIINKSGKTLSSFTNQDEDVQILKNQQTTKIQLPFSVEVATKDKLVFDSVVYDIVDVPIKHSLMGAFIISVERQK
jgi:hypothetical protein